MLSALPLLSTLNTACKEAQYMSRKFVCTEALPALAEAVT